MSQNQIGKSSHFQVKIWSHFFYCHPALEYILLTSPRWRGPRCAGAPSRRRNSVPRTPSCCSARSPGRRRSRRGHGSDSDPSWNAEDGEEESSLKYWGIGIDNSNKECWYNARSLKLIMMLMSSLWSECPWARSASNLRVWHATFLTLSAVDVRIVLLTVTTKTPSLRHLRRSWAKNSEWVSEHGAFCNFLFARIS